MLVSQSSYPNLAYALDQNWPGGLWWHWLVFSVIIIAFILIMVPGFIWFERRAVARMQARLGPNRVGPLGILQVVADAFKIFTKEDIIPTCADKLVHLLAPLVIFIPVVMLFAVVPFQDGALLADLNVGILYLVAISSISSIGVFMAGWGSGNKYTLLGAMRDIAAVVSYEIPVMLSLVGVVLLSGSMSLNTIVQGQQNIPYILLQPLGFLLFFLSSCAEINRAPFDMLEADSELVAGYNTEYSGMKFAILYLSEYAEALAMSAIIATLFLGGWQWLLLPPWLWLIIKTVAVFFLMMWVRTTVLRLRIDQLMAFGWKFLFPLALINLLITAGEVLLFPNELPWLLVPVNIVIGIVLVVLWSRFYKVGWGRVDVGTLR
jgi:NADH-quinone oxidoreductase subunit H